MQPLDETDSVNWLLILITLAKHIYQLPDDGCEKLKHVAAPLM